MLERLKGKWLGKLVCARDSPTEMVRMVVKVKD